MKSAKDVFTSGIGPEMAGLFLHTNDEVKDLKVSAGKIVIGKETQLSVASGHRFPPAGRPIVLPSIYHHAGAVFRPS
jgi:hypothetical protein